MADFPNSAGAIKLDQQLLYKLCLLLYFENGRLTAILQPGKHVLIRVAISPSLDSRYLRKE